MLKQRVGLCVYSIRAAETLTPAETLTSEEKERGEDLVDSVHSDKRA